MTNNRFTDHGRLDLLRVAFFFFSLAYVFVCVFQETYEKRREVQQKELKEKEEGMRQMFVQRVKDKEQVLKKSESEVGLCV